MAGKINPRVHMRAGSEWVDITSDVRVSEDITINRGRRDEASSVDPGTCDLVLNNRHGRYSPRHPGSPYYGLIGRNTPIRVRVGTPPPAPSPELADSFGRTVVDGWGTADTGQTWTVELGAAADASVDGGVGRLVLPAVDAATGVLTSAPLAAADVDLTLRLRIDTAPLGEAYDGVLIQVYTRFDGVNGVFAELEVGSDTGRPDGGLRLSTRLATNTETIAPQQGTPGMAAHVHEWLWVRLQAIGPEVRLRVWPDGTDEPEVWHGQGYTSAVTAAGQVGIAAVVRADGTPAPVTVEVDDLQVRPPTEEDIRTRFVGEVSEWPMRWDLSGSDVWVPVTASGILRRLSQGSSAQRSPLAATIPAYQPVAYWPLEDGPDAGISAASGLEGGQPLRVQDLDFGASDGPPGSAPLPTVGLSAAMVSPHIEMRDTGAWEVAYLYYLAGEDFPTGPDEILSVSATGTAQRWRLSLETVGGVQRLDVAAYDADGTQIVDGGGDTRFAGAAVTFTDAWRYLRLTVWQDGADVRYEAAWGAIGEDVWSFFTNTVAGSAGVVSSIATTFGNEIRDKLTIGHVSVWGARKTPAYYTANVGNGYAGETARTRISRLSAQAGVPMVVTGQGTTRLGPQPSASYLDIASEAAAADGGILYEQRAALGLAYRSRDTLYNRGRPEGIGE